MADAAPNPMPTELRRFSAYLPRLIWISIAVAVAVLVGARLGIPIYRQFSALREIRRMRDPAAPMDERKAIAIVMSYFADKHGGWPIDAYFDAHRELDGFVVVVQPEGRRDLFGRAWSSVGSDCWVEISTEGSIVSITGGL